MLAWKAALIPRKWHYQLGKKTVENINLLTKDQRKKLNIYVDKVSIDYPDYIALLIRRTFPQLERNLKPECNKLYKLYGATWQERNKCYVFPSGAKVYLVHCQDRRALDNYIGGNYHFIGIDEVNQFPEGWVDELSTSARTANQELKTQICLTSNPGNIGHVWLKKRFVEKCPPVPVGERTYNKAFDVWQQKHKSGDAYIDEEGISYKFIPATVFDNPTILENDPGYVRKLKNLNPILRSMWLEGNWDVFAGVFFDSWNMMHHIVPEKEFVYGKDFDRETHALFRFYDYGTKAPFVCLFGALSREGVLTIFDEIAETGLSASKQAAEVVRYTWQKYKLKSTDFDDDIADPAYWTKHSEKEGALYSPSMFYGDAGIYLARANNDRKAGAKLVYEALTIDDEGNSRVRFRENCLYCIETIPNLPASETDPEDIDTKAEDHAYDALRYGCMRILPELMEEQGEKKQGWRDRLFDDRSDGPKQSWKTA